MRMNYLALLILATAPLVGYAASRTFDFGGDTVGQPPKGFVFGHTAKVGAPGTWVVQSEGANQYLAQTNGDSTRSRFPVAVVSDISTADVDASVRFKPPGWSGVTRTKTTTTWCAPTRSKTTSCCTRSSEAGARICR